jgi:dipeptidyl aminopeptidase/acylaminoacyl peptidase
LVAYARDGALVTVPVSGGKERVLVADGVRADEQHPVAWSPDGRWIAYGSGILVSPSGRVCRPFGLPLHDFTWAPRSHAFVGLSATGALWWRTQEGQKERVLTGPWGASSFRFDPTGRRLAISRIRRRGEKVTRSSLWTLDLESGARTKLVDEKESASALRVAGWAPDGSWILYWRENISASLSADGAPLMAVPASGGDPVKVLESMLPYRDFLTWCEDALVATAGGGRDITKGKYLVRVSAPEWQAVRLRNTDTQLKNEYWPSCAPKPYGSYVAATASPDRFEDRVGTLPRSIHFFTLQDQNRGGFSLPREAAEYPLWAEHDRGTTITLLFVSRERGGDRAATLYLQRGEGSTEVAELGPVDGYYAHYDYSSIMDWYQPGLLRNK